MALFAQKSYQVAAITAGGPDQDLSIAGIGNPVAVVIEASRVTALGTGVDHGILSQGISDGTTHIVGCNRMRDAQTTLDTGRMLWKPGLILIMNVAANTVDGQAVFKNWITDGVRITWTDFPAGAYMLTVTFFYGTRAQAFLLHAVTVGTQNLVESLTGASFKPNIALDWYWRLAPANPAAAANNAFIHHGCAVDNEGTVEQWCVDISDRDARGVAHGWGFTGRDDAIIQDITQNASGGVLLGGYLQVQSFISGGISVKTLDASISFNFPVLFLSTGGNRVTAKLNTFDSNTAGSAGATKKIVATSPSGTWKPKIARTVGTTL